MTAPTATKSRFCFVGQAVRGHRFFSLLTTVLFIFPVLAYAQVSAALAELNKANLFEGVRRLKEIVRVEPSSAAYFYLATVYTGIGRYDTAYRYLETARKANPGQGAYYHQLGIIRRHEGCHPEALA